MLDFTNTQTLITLMLEQHSQNFENSPAICYQEETLGYAELSLQVQKVICLIETLELPKNICIALRFNDPINHLIFILALLKLNITQTSISTSYSNDQAKKRIKNIGVDLIIQDITLNDIIKKETIYIDKYLNIEKNIDGDIKANKTLSLDTAIVFLGSGTTGKPKLIQLNQKIYSTVLSNDLNVSMFEKFDKVYIPSNLYSPFCLRRTILALLQGSSVLLHEKKSINIIDFCTKHNVQHLLLRKDQALDLVLWAQKNNKQNSLFLPNLKTCTVSHSIINQPLRDLFMTYFSTNLCISYGTNEFGNIAEATPLDVLKYPGTVGKINPNVKLKIINEHGEECKIDEIGQICVKTSNMIHQYSNNKKASKKSFQGGWYYPGDLGRLNKDGHLIIEGRSDDLMIYYGTNIYPRELEEVLDSHPNVVESAVFPLQVNHHDGVPFAVVTVEKPMSEKELLQYCQDKIGWKRPQRIFFAKQLPKNDAGKILKRELSRQTIQLINSLNKGSKNDSL